MSDMRSVASAPITTTSAPQSMSLESFSSANVVATDDDAAPASEV